MQQRRTAIVIGDGQLAAQCAKAIARHDGIDLRLVVHHPSGHQWSSQVQKFSKDFSIPRLPVDNVNDAAAVATINEVRPDIIFSVNNWDVIRADLLAVPPDGIINFHNGPLPRYRGVNSPSWAIINGEQHYGVTWHLVDENIDTGDIVATSEFELTPNETAVSLMFKCMSKGAELLPPLLDRYVSGRLDARPQEGDSRYYSAKDVPNDGYLDFSRPFERLSALVRGLTFRPFENQFTYPKIQTSDRTLLVTSIARDIDRPESKAGTCGEVLGLDHHGILVRAQDCAVRLSGLMDEDLADISDTEAFKSRGVRVGAVLRGQHG
jgi:methionyl-tRNA formyltransferase